MRLECHKILYKARTLSSDCISQEIAELASEAGSEFLAISWYDIIAEFVRSRNNF